MALSGTAALGPETTYSSNMVEVRQLEEMLTLISPDEQPVLDLIGLGSGGSVSNWKVEWQEDEIFPTVAYIDETGNITSGVTNFTIQADTSAGSATGFVMPGDLLKVEDEIMWVTAVDGEEVYVTRGYSGSTAAAHNDNVQIDIIGRALQEGSSPGYARYIAPTQPYGVTQIEMSAQL